MQMRSSMRLFGVLALMLLLVALSTRPARAIESADHDAFFIALGTANITVENSDALLQGNTVIGGIRFGLLSFFFLELGYGTVGYSDTVDINGVTKRFSFRTTGPNYGMGLVIPIRKLRVGARYQRHPNNKWSEEIIDDTTGVTDSNISGDIDFESESVFGQFLDGRLEVGVRQDTIRSSDSALQDSFGVYVMWNIKTD